MTETHGIQLSLLEGMDEDLLVRLHGQGIRTRVELERCLATEQGRRELAPRLHLPVERLEALHHLNFLLPEERAERFLRLERASSDTLGSVERRLANVRRLVLLLAALLVAALVAAGAGMWWLGSRTSPSPEEGLSLLETAGVLEELQELRLRVDSLQPLAEASLEKELQRALSELGPAPGWHGPLAWDMVDHRRLTVILGDSPDTEPMRAVSLALAHLATLESRAGQDTLSMVQIAAEAARLLGEFPSPGMPGTIWDAAAVILRLRLQTRALGSAPDVETPAEAYSLVPWPWTATGFLQTEALLSRLESLDLHADALPLWSQTLMTMRRASNDARSEFGDQPEAWARDYWILRGEMELAVSAQLLGKRRLLPYRSESPLEVLRQRGAYLERTMASAPPGAMSMLAWLAVEFAEAERLVEWIDDVPSRRDRADGHRWLAAIQAVGVRRLQEGVEISETLEAKVRRALELSGVDPGADPFRHPRTRHEAGLRPILMETRAAGLAPPGSAPREPAAEPGNG